MYIGGGTNTAPYYGQISLTNATLTAQGNRPLNLAQAPIGGRAGRIQSQCRWSVDHWERDGQCWDNHFAV